MKKTIIILLLTGLMCGLVFAQENSKSITKAAEAINKGDVQGAIAVLNKAIENNEKTFEVYRMRGMLYGMTGNIEGEFADISKAIELKSTEGALYEQRANLRMFLRHDTNLILNDLDLAVANGQKVERVYNMRASIRRFKGDIEGAIADFQTAIGLNPDSAASTIGLASIIETNKQDDAQATLILENFLSRYENSLEKLSTIKEKVVAQGDAIIYRDEEKNVIAGSSAVIIKDDSKFSGPPTPEQLRKLEYNLEQKKNTAMAYSNLASLYEKRGDYEKALEIVEKAIKIDPTDKHGFGVRGKIKSSMKDYEGAIKDLTVAIKSTPSFPNYYIDRGVAYLMMNNDLAAEKDFAQYLEITALPIAKQVVEKKIAEAKKKREENNQ